MIDIKLSEDVYIGSDDLSWFKGSEDMVMVAISKNRLKRLQEYIEAVESSLDFDSDGILHGAKGLDWRVANIVSAIFDVTKPQRKHQVTIAFDVWACEKEQVEDAVRDALEDFGLDKSRETVRID